MKSSRQLCWLIGLLSLIAFTLSAGPIEQWRIVIGLVLSSAVVLMAFALRLLALDALAPAVCVGTITLGFGGWGWAFMLIWYFISSSLLAKRKVQDYELSDGERRDAVQVWANGLAITFLLILYQFTGWLAIWVGAAAGLATANADTWATEIGTRWARKAPRLITTGEKVRPGADGGLTFVGTIGGMAGSLIIAIFTTVLANYPEIKILSVVFGAGTLGMLLDSLLGATWERKLPPRLSQYVGHPALTNNHVNALSVFGSALLAMIFFI
ncbi:MAG: DUF92 domain-containing protein [Bacteroidota bacterium]